MLAVTDVHSLTGLMFACEVTFSGDEEAASSVIINSNRLTISQHICFVPLGRRHAYNIHHHVMADIHANHARTDTSNKEPQRLSVLHIAHSDSSLSMQHSAQVCMPLAS
jgi:hypothetical protein